jgi:hypothetical protein
MLSRIALAAASVAMAAVTMAALVVLPATLVPAEAGPAVADARAPRFPASAGAGARIVAAARPAALSARRDVPTALIQFARAAAHVTR